MSRHYEYKVRELKLKTPPLVVHHEDDEEVDGWQRVWTDVTDSGAFFVYRRPAPEESTTTLRPPPVSKPSERPYDGKDVHRAAYRVRRILAGEEVAGVDDRLTHDYRLVYAVLSALKDSVPATRARALAGKWMREARRIKETVQAIESGRPVAAAIGALPEALKLIATPEALKSLKLLVRRSEEVAKELEEALDGK